MLDLILILAHYAGILMLLGLGVWCIRQIVEHFKTEK